MRPAAGRRVGFVALAAVCLAALLPRVVFDAQTPSPAPAEGTSRLERLEQWTTALERHEPGEADGALTRLPTGARASSPS